MYIYFHKWQFDGFFCLKLYGKFLFLSEVTSVSACSDPSISILLEHKHKKFEINGQRIRVAVSREEKW